MDSPVDRNHDGKLFCHLNDAYVKEVFTFLQLSDLCIVAEVCKRFKVIAEEIFKTDYADKQTFDLLKLIEGNKDFHSQWFMVRSLTETFIQSAEQLLRNFGSLIEALRLTGTGKSFGMDDNDLLILVKHNCPSLKALTLDAIGNDDDYCLELRVLFRGLEKLTIVSSFGDDLSQSFADLLSDCRNLKYLNVNGVSDKMWLNHQFPKLETLVMTSSWDFDGDVFEWFLKKHQNLRSLTYDAYYVYATFFGILSRASPQLETLHCNINSVEFYDHEKEVEENVLQLPRLKSLNTLTIACETNALNLLVTAFEKECTPIKNFQIVNSRMDSELFLGLSKLKTMETLKLTQCEMTAEILVSVNHYFNRLDKVVIEDPTGFAVSTLKQSKQSKKRPREVYDNILCALNDDCLATIFKYLPLTDLCNVADVCKSFRRNAETVFQSRHKIVKTEELSNDMTDMHLAEQFFRNFGAFIQELSLNGSCLKGIADQENLMHLAAMYCDPMLLQTLSLDRMFIEHDMRWIRPNLKLFFWLPRLELLSCRLNENFGKFLSQCRIAVIQVNSMYQSRSSWMKYTFPHLRSLIMHKTWLLESSMDEFTKLNGHLIQLVIHESMFSSTFFKTVADHLPSLREFYFSGSSPQDRQSQKNVLHLARLRSLSSLTLNCGRFSVKNLVDAFVTASTPLSQINIVFGDVDMELLLKLNNIQTPLTGLELRRVNMKGVSLIDIVKTLPNLTKLDIDIEGIVTRDIITMLPFAEKLAIFKVGHERSNVLIDIQTYDTILAIVKNRQNFNKLTIHIIGPDRQVSVPRKVLWANSYWLHIENEIWNVSATDSELEISELSDDQSDEEGVMFDDNTDSELDVSGWSVVDSGDDFVVPELMSEDSDH